MSEIEAINKIFDKQIRQAANPYIHEINKELFNLTINFTIEDWRKIRTQKYWEKMKDLSSDFERKKYTLTCVNFYLKNIKK